jgi:hypothetical protein
VIVTGELWTVFPPRVAFTKSVTAPAVFAAVNVTWFPVEEFRAPMELLVRVHE